MPLKKFVTPRSFCLALSYSGARGLRHDEAHESRPRQGNPKKKMIRFLQNPKAVHLDIKKTAPPVVSYI